MPKHVVNIFMVNKFIMFKLIMIKTYNFKEFIINFKKLIENLVFDFIKPPKEILSLEHVKLHPFKYLLNL